MAISLRKGQKIDLTKGTSLKKAMVGLGWKTDKYEGRYDFDLDASVFLVGKNGKTNHDEDFIFYNNLIGRNEAVVHSGDNRTGGDGVNDDEQINIDFSKIPHDVERIAITVTIHEAEARRQNFGQVTDAYVRVVDAETNEEVLRYELGEDFSIETAIVAAEIYKKNDEWRFDAVGSGFSGGLLALCHNYGLQTTED